MNQHRQAVDSEDQKEGMGLKMKKAESQSFHVNSESMSGQNSAKGDVFSRLQKSTTITSRRKERTNAHKHNTEYDQMVGERTMSEEYEAEFEQPVHNLSCSFVVENAHNNPIYSMATAYMSNQLYTSSTRSLKIWDLDRMECISDIQ